MKKVYTHNDFTATFTDEGGYFSLTGHTGGGSGACGDTIASIDNRFKLLESMHLCNAETGEPMHALENGFYHFEKAGFDIAALEKYWGIALTEPIKIALSTYLESGVFNDLAKWRTVNTPQEFSTRKDATKFDTLAFKEQQRLCKAMVKSVMDNFAVSVWKARADEVRKVTMSIPSDLTDIDKDISIDGFSEPEKVRALASFLDIHFSLVEESGGCYDGGFSVSGKDYMVLTDDEADTLWDEYLENYIDDCLEIPEHMENYFDREAWKRDVRRGHSLSSYDGEENCQNDSETSETFYIYRQ